MDVLRISRLHARYRLPATAPDATPRLDRVLRAVLEDGVENALARSGVPVHEEICIRSAHVPVRLKSASADTALIGTWSVGLADTIQRTIQDGGPDVVRYRTRNHALLDLLLGVASADFRHAWAWRMLGLWTLDDQPSTSAGGPEAVRALVAHPASVVAALAGAARAGALARLAAVVPPSAWLELVRAALGASPLSPGGVRRLLSEAGLDVGEAAAPGRDRGDGAPRPGPFVATDGPPADPAPLDPSRDGAASVVRRAKRVAGRSEIARALRTVPAHDARLAFLLSVLAVLEGEPSALEGDGAWASVLVGQVLRESLGEGGPGTVEGDGGRGPGSVATDGSTRHRHGGGAQEDAVGAATDRTRRGGPEESPEAPGVGDGRPERGARSEPTSPESVDAPVRDGQEPDEEAPAAAPLTDVEATPTEWGGLLFLLHVVDELGLPAEILSADVFGSRSLPWVLHGIARRLLDLDGDDPAAAAFAGVVPGGPAPWDGDDPATQAEDGALEDLARRVAHRVHERMGGEPPPDARAAAATVRACARRRAELFCETGWFDVVLRLDEVVVEVRRAGLDLDPGWIPWLGAVVRFVYV